MDWFYGDSGKQIGPIDETSFAALVASGIVRDETLVWHAGMANWQPYTTVRPAPQPPPVPIASPDQRFCTECGRAYPSDELLAFGNSLVCAACKPLFTQKLREGIRPAGSVRYGGFWIRYLAVLVDSLIFSVLIVMVFAIGVIAFPVDFANIGRSQADLLKLLAIEGVVWLSALLFAAIYETWMIGRYGATLGKMACSLTVVTSDGGKVSYGRALGRHFAKHLSSFILGIGYIMAGFDEEKRALHDRICDTRVIKK
ncbi:MAG TPA: RDD family protein [Bryobacteraceae bacterium]|nr:RDD family protein [Bryobacteraceae bacterium]